MIAQRCSEAVDVVKSRSLLRSAPLEGCLRCEPLPSSGCHGAWTKARLCWTLPSDNVSHYVVWTCCPADVVRTPSALRAHESRALASESSISETSLGTESSYDERLSDDKLSGDNAGEREAVDLSTAEIGPPAKIIRRDHRSVDTSGSSVSVWRCLGLTPVASFGVELKSLSLDYRRSFSVQPVLFGGVVLQRVSVVVK